MIRMFNASEVTTVKARHRSALSLAGLAAGFAIAAAPLDVSAQGMGPRTPPPDAPRIMVPALKGSEKNVGVQAADAIRSRLNQDVPYKQLYVLPKTDIVAMLEASGYNPNEPLPPNDAKELAKLLRADEYLEGTVTKSPSGYRIESRLVLARDNSLVQPLPPVEGARLDLAAKSLSGELQNARKQLESERTCVRLAREGKYKEAAAAAQAGITAYPQATLARNCQMQAYSQLKYPGDSVLRIAQEILAINPRFRPALGLAAQAYTEKGDTTRAVQTWTELIAANPGDANLVERVVTNIAALPGQAKVAIPIIDKAVAENPGDTKLLDIQSRLKFVTKDWKGAVASMDEVAKLDTAMMDTTYFQRLAAAQLNDSQPQRAAEAMARATQKFPTHASSWLFYAQMLRQSGQLDQAETAARRALSLNPNIEGGLPSMVQLQLDAGKLDSAYATIATYGLAPAARTCVTTAADSTKAEWQTSCKASYQNADFLAQLARGQGNKFYRAAAASAKAEDFDPAVKWLLLADSVKSDDNTKLLLTASYVTRARPLLLAAQASKDCALAKKANDGLVEAGLMIPKIGKVNPTLAGQLFQAAQGYLPSAEAMVKQYCK
jgi:tetratricopeptide (TPR) repeat protein